MLFYFASNNFIWVRVIYPYFTGQKIRLWKIKLKSCVLKLFSHVVISYVLLFFPSVGCLKNLILQPPEWLSIELWWSIPTRLVKDVKHGLVKWGPEVSYDLSFGMNVQHLSPPASLPILYLLHIHTFFMIHSWIFLSLIFSVSLSLSHMKLYSSLSVWILLHLKKNLFFIM